ncbi:hypothetical protein BDF20DRAFT_824041 [Mycotypha africana]|uniref:uncharacterized protein n=1 Tax=Mycotypha africana TaxID=64632 RepID=UPI0022FFFFAA|nr:uncharacterized protein BDF20DRAFT_824041 [Mycotypha africana]KAI8973248.1 hypothetical protein BDF20DRAFT_824041 [Mycotypha africana]
MFLTALEAYSHTKQINKVRNTFNTYKFNYRLKMSSYIQYMQAVINCQDIPTAIQIFRDIHSHPRLKFQPVVSQCLALILPFLIQNHNFDAALKLTDEFIESQQQQHHAKWHANSKLYITQVLWQGFLTYLPLPSPSTSISDGHALIPVDGTNVPLTSKSLETFVEQYAQDLFNLIRLAHPYVQPTVKTCNALIQLSGSDQQQFKSILQWMKNSNIQPDAETIGVILDQSYSQIITPERAKELYQILKEQSTITTTGKSENLSRTLCNAFVKLLPCEDVYQLEIEAKGKGIFIDPLSMIKGFIRRKEFEKGWTWLQHQQHQQQQQQQQCKITLDTYATLLEGLLQAGQWNSLIQYYVSLEQQYGRQTMNTHRKLVSCALTAHLAKHDIDSSLQLLKSLRNQMTPTHIYKTTLNLCRLESEKSGYPLIYGSQIVKSLRIMESTLHVYLDAEKMARIIAKLGHRGECREAHMLYRYVREGGHAVARARGGDSRIYRAMMSAATLNNRMDLLERTWHEMCYRKCRFLDEPFEKEQPNLAAFNVLLNGYASQLPRPDINRISRIYERLLEQGLQPNLVTYNILIKTFVNCGNMDAAHQLFDVMIKEQVLDKGDNNSNVRLYTSNTLLSGWIRQAQWDKVENFVKDHRDKLDIVTFNMLVQCFLHLNPKTVSALKLLKYQHQWKVRENFQQEYAKCMSSDKIWNLFESVTGYTRHTIENIPLVHSTTSPTSISTLSIPAWHTLLNSNDTSSRKKAEGGFIDYFVNVKEPNEATYNLFMKAFTQVNDQASAKSIYSWLKYQRQQELL